MTIFEPLSTTPNQLKIRVLILNVLSNNLITSNIDQLQIGRDLGAVLIAAYLESR